MATKRWAKKTKKEKRDHAMMMVSKRGLKPKDLTSGSLT